MQKYGSALITLITLWLLSGCSAMFNDGGSQKAISSSLVEFLYPDEQSRQAQQVEIPTLRLPVTIGVAFVPPKNTYYSDTRHEISNSNQLILLEKVKEAFSQYDYIDRIELIPSTYLKGGSGFTTLEQVARLHDVELMALISYDQVMQTRENNAALLYWTIVGMYVIPGNQNSVQTFVDTAVFDVSSRKMLFRAPGLSQSETLSTAVGVSDTRSEQSYQGFELAMADMVVNLNDELGRFKTRVKEEQIVKVENKSGYSGGGALGVVGLFSLFAVALRRRQVILQR